MPLRSFGEAEVKWGLGATSLGRNAPHFLEIVVQVELQKVVIRIVDF